MGTHFAFRKECFARRGMEERVFSGAVARARSLGAAPQTPSQGFLIFFDLSAFLPHSPAFRTYFASRRECFAGRGMEERVFSGAVARTRSLGAAPHPPHRFFCSFLAYPLSAVFTCHGSSHPPSHRQPFFIPDQSPASRTSSSIVSV